MGPTILDKNSNSSECVDSEGESVIAQRCCFASLTIFKGETFAIQIDSQ